MESAIPRLSASESMRAVYQPDGGYVRSEVAIEAYAAAARALGAEIVTNAPVHGWERGPAGVGESTRRAPSTRPGNS